MLHIKHVTQKVCIKLDLLILQFAGVCDVYMQEIPDNITLLKSHGRTYFYLL